MKTEKTNSSSYSLFLGNCREVMQSEEFKKSVRDKRCVIVTDPPFNIGYHYKTYTDKMAEGDYYNFLDDVFSLSENFVVIHYPEEIYKIARHMDKLPRRVIAWVYNSNTARQHRDIAFFGITPDFSLVRQPYKNLNDKRIQKRIAEGKTGARLYDWWNENQVKNVSREKTIHPCQMPQTIMDNIIGIIPDKENIVVVDPFMGSGTTGLACKKYGVDFVGIELDEAYYELCERRMAS